MIDPKLLQDPSRYSLGRRDLLKGAAAGAAALSVSSVAFRAFAAETLTVADPGGAWTPACDAAFVKPFEKETGVAINHIARQHYPSVEIKANVETKSYTWDVVIATDADVYELAPQNLLEPLDWSGEDMAQIIPEAHQPGWLGSDLYCTIIAYRSDKYGKNGPQSWADFWDVKKFPGRRAMHKHPIDMLEVALMADGVPKDKVYPIDVDRALKKLDEIKPHVDVWWTGGAQTTEMLQSGEVDMMPTWNGRAQVVIDAGKPVEIVWNQGIYALEGWVVPKGAPKAELGKKFIKFCANAKQQSIFAQYIAYGPTNPGAYETIDKARAEILPTAPTHLKEMIQLDHEYWAKNQEKAIERFDTWMLA